MLPKKISAVKTPVSERLAKWRKKKEDKTPVMNMTKKSEKMSQTKKTSFGSRPLLAQNNTENYGTKVTDAENKTSIAIKKEKRVGQKRKASKDCQELQTTDNLQNDQNENPVKKRRIAEGTIAKHAKPMGLSQRMKESQLKAIERLQKRKTTETKNPYLVVRHGTKPRQLKPVGDLNSTIQMLFSTPEDKQKLKHDNVAQRNKSGKPLPKKSVQQPADKTKNKTKDISVKRSTVSSLAKKPTLRQSDKGLNSTLQLLFSTPDNKEKTAEGKQPGKLQKNIITKHPRTMKTQEYLTHRLQRWREHREEEKRWNSITQNSQPTPGKAFSSRKSVAPKIGPTPGKMGVAPGKVGSLRKSLLSSQAVIPKKLEGIKKTNFQSRSLTSRKSLAPITKSSPKKPMPSRKSLAPNIKLNAGKSSVVRRSPRTTRRSLSGSLNPGTRKTQTDFKTQKPPQTKPSRRATLAATTDRTHTPIKERLEKWRKKKEEEKKVALQDRRKTLPPFVSCISHSVKKEFIHGNHQKATDNLKISRSKTPGKGVQPHKSAADCRKTELSSKPELIRNPAKTTMESKRTSFTMLHHKKKGPKIVKPVKSLPSRQSLDVGDTCNGKSHEVKLTKRSSLPAKQKARFSISKPASILEPPILDEELDNILDVNHNCSLTSEEEHNQETQEKCDDLVPARRQTRRSILKTAPPAEPLFIPEKLIEESSVDPGSPTLMNIPVTPPQSEKFSHVRFACTPLQGRCSSRPQTPASIPFECDLEKQSMREKLDSWLVAHGKTPTRFRHLCCFGDRLDGKGHEFQPVQGGLSSQELLSQQELIDQEESPGHYKRPIDDPLHEQLNELLEESMLLFEAGCSAKDINHWLAEIEKNIPGARQSARYWICRARVAEEEGNDNLAVDLYETAARNIAKPAEEVAEALKEFVIRLNDRQQARQLAAHTPKHARDVQEENMFTSSAVKYSLNKTTPFFSRLRANLNCKNTPKAVITPVRRSTRRSHASLPKMLQDHDEVYETLKELPKDACEGALFQPNCALNFDDLEDDDVDTLDSQIMAADFSFGSENNA